MAEVRFWWIRHAPVVGNDGRCYGVNDVDCDVSEKNKFIKLAKLLPKNSSVYSSHLLRTIKTFRATEKQRNREDKIDWTVNRFGFLRTILWIIVSILAIALLARMFI